MLNSLLPPRRHPMQLPLLIVVGVLLLKHASADRIGSLSLLLLGITLGDSLHRQEPTPPRPDR
ncbi:hypothetical protein [Aquitalea pelogenes]|uniref:hypothetical protein n=1 Tax=Aquitalea pelogenes TaxID=1293573 RepID=UPI0035AF0233